MGYHFLMWYLIFILESNISFYWWNSKEIKINATKLTYHTLTNYIDMNRIETGSTSFVRNCTVTPWLLETYRIDTILWFPRSDLNNSYMMEFKSVFIQGSCLKHFLMIIYFKQIQSLCNIKNGLWIWHFSSSVHVLNLGINCICKKVALKISN